MIARLPFRLLGNVGGRLFGTQTFVKDEERSLRFASTKLA